MPFIIFIVILLESHLLRDKDFPKEIKVGSMVVFGVITVLYLLSRVL